MKLWLKILLGFLVLVALGIIAAMIILDNSENALENELISSRHAIAQEAMREIDMGIVNGELDQVQKDAWVLRNNRALKESNSFFENMSEEEREDYIQEKDKEWQESENLTGFMREIYENDLSNKILNEIQIEKTYIELHKQSPFPEVFVTNKYGVVAGMSGKISDYYQADENWWKQAKKKGFYAGDVRIDASAGIVMAMDLVVKIEDEEGNFQGILKAVLDADKFMGIVENIKKEELKHFSGSREEMEAHLVNNEGEIIHSTADYDSFEKFPYAICGKEEKAPEGEECKKWIKTENKEGKEILLVHAHSEGYREYEGRGWSFILEYEVEEILLPLINLRKDVYLVIFLSVIIGFIVIYFIARRISGPEEKLREKTEQLEDFARLSSGREEKMIELKEKINQLEKEIGREPSFDMEKIEQVKAEEKAKERGLESLDYKELQKMAKKYNIEATQKKDKLIKKIKKIRENG